MNGTLFIVGVPIGNDGDISLRAIETLRSVSLIACEDFREAKRLLRRLEIEKPLIEISEHTEEENVREIIDALQKGENVAQISDAGMPLLADPGSTLLQIAIELGINVTTVPGPTSIMSALILSGFDFKKFFFYGFLSVKREQRVRELYSLKHHTAPIVFLDTPYRLLPVLEDIMKAFGQSRMICVATDLTMPHEYIFRGTTAEALAHFSKTKKKNEFVIIVDGKK